MTDPHPMRPPGGRPFSRLVRALWHRVPLSAGTRRRIERGFPAVTAHFSAPAPSSGNEPAQADAVSQPSVEFPRPPARQKMPMDRADHRAIGHRAQPAETLASPAARLVAFYGALDREPGGGDPEPVWAEVSRARPQFEGHAQPRLPGELGFYDPLSPEVMSRQVALAQRHGIAAFAFVVPAGPTGAVLPLDRYLARPELDLSFCLCADVGRAAAPDFETADFAARLTGALGDPRHLRRDDKALLVVRHPEHLENAAQTIRAWRDACLARGLGELLICGWSSDESLDPRPLGCDVRLSTAGGDDAPAITSRQGLLHEAYRGEVLDWRRRTAADPSRGDSGCPHFAVVDVGHDDEPRRPARGRVLLHASPRGYADWLQRTIVESARLAPGPALVFVDAWNDWSRGAVLEPDARLGYAYLVATREALRRAGDAVGGRGVGPPSRPCAVVHVYYVELLDEIAFALRAARLDWRLVVTTPPDREALVRARLAALGLVAEVEAHENRGRDILPFLRVANRLLDEGVDVVLKLHTKHSGHRSDGDAWRAELIGRLLEPSRAATHLAAFARDPRLGCVAPEGHLLPLSVYWGWNEDNVRALCVRMGIRDPQLAQDRFVAGSMFWVRLAALRPLLDAHLGEWEFEPEGGYVDGTLAHAIERALTLAVVGAGYRSETSAAICGIPFHESGYAYAQATAPTGSP